MKAYTHHIYYPKKQITDFKLEDFINISEIPTLNERNELLKVVAFFNDQLENWKRANFKQEHIKELRRQLIYWINKYHCSIVNEYHSSKKVHEQEN